MYTREEAKQIRKKFWVTFGYRCKRDPGLRKKKWVLYDTKIRGIDLKFEVDRNEALVMIEINSRSEARRLQCFETIEKYKAIIEDGLEEPLSWNFCIQKETGQEVGRIYISQADVDIHQQNQWPDIFNFMIDNMLKLETNFMEIRDLLLEELK